MNVLPANGSFVFIFDTEDYSGNFEREAVAYITGEVGECGVGEECVWRDAPPWFKNNVRHMLDDNGNCRRPATIWATPGWLNNGMGGHYREGEDPAVVAKTYQEAVDQYANKYEKNPKAREEFIAARSVPGRFPAYQSVAVVFRERPPNVVLLMLRERTQAFCRERGIKLTRTRLVEFKVTTETISSFEEGQWD